MVVVSITQLDKIILEMILQYRAPLLTEFFIQITDIGSVVLMGIVIVGLWLLKKREEAVLSATGVITAGGISHTSKLLIGRPRPQITEHIINQPIATYAFPSGHAALSFVMATILAKKHPELGKYFYTIAGLIAISRVYLGVHYTTDILAGAVLGIIVGLGVLRYEDKLLQTVRVEPKA